VFAGANGVDCVHGKGPAVLSSSWEEAQLRAQSRLLVFTAKTQMAMRCRGVVKREVGVTYCGVQGSCEDGRQGVWSCHSMV